VEPVEAVDLIETHGLTSAGACRSWCASYWRRRPRRARALDLVGLSSGGAPVPPDLIRRVETQFEQKASPANGYA